jgi:hypothetical protein
MNPHRHVKRFKSFRALTLAKIEGELSIPAAVLVAVFIVSYLYIYK